MNYLQIDFHMRLKKPSFLECLTTFPTALLQQLFIPLQQDLFFLIIITPYC